MKTVCAYCQIEIERRPCRIKIRNYCCARHQMLFEYKNDLRDKIKNNKKENGDGYCYNYSRETIKELKRIARWCEIASELMYHVEWLYSGDDSEETFSKKIRKVK